VVNPDLKAESKNTPGDYRGGWPLDNPVGLYDEKENNIYILQLWFDSTPKAERLRCRLFDGQGKKLLRQTSYWMSGKDAKHIANLPKLPGRIGLRTWNRAASIDYIRVFELQ